MKQTHCYIFRAMYFYKYNLIEFDKKKKNIVINMEKKSRGSDKQMKEA